MAEAGWSVITVAREPPEVIRRFVAWHLERGAARIVIHFDDPDDPCVDLVAHLPQVEAVRCTASFWASIGVDPGRKFTYRQNRATDAAYRRADTPWVLNLDADELMLVEDRRIGALLADQPDEVRVLQVKPAETVRLAGDPAAMAFRCPLTRAECNRVYGDFAPLMRRNGGMAGHPQGKSFLRRGQHPIRMRQHWIETPEGVPIVDRELGADDGAVLLHFLGTDYEVWRRKLPHRLDHKGFRPRLRDHLAARLAAGDETGLRETHARMHTLEADAAELLRSRGRLIAPDLALDAKVALYF